MRIAHSLALLYTCLAIGPVLAQNAATNIAPVLSAGDTRSLLAELKDARNQADVLNQFLGKLTATNSGLAWLKALNLHFKVFEPSAAGQDAGLGVEYDFDKGVTDARFFGEENPAYLTFNLKARGNISFDKNNNPTDFLQSGAQLHLWQFFGQTDDDPVGSDGLTLSSRTFRELASDKFKGKSGNELRATPEWRNYQSQAFEKDPAEWFYDLAANFALESDQTFSKKQYAYGLEIQPRVRVWDPDSPWSKFNLFDWPFACTRMLGGEEWKPRGRFLPGIMAGLDLIDPAGNSDRFAVDADEGAYPRFKAEVGFRSKVVEIQGKPVWFSAAYRYFQELGASSAIEAADLDAQHYFAASLDLPGNITITYSTGKLPFDLQDQQVWALGYRVKF